MGSTVPGMRTTGLGSGCHDPLHVVPRVLRGGGFVTSLRDRIETLRRLPLRFIGAKAIRKALSPVVEIGALHVFSWSPVQNTSSPHGFEAREVPRNEIAGVAIMLGRSVVDFCVRAARGERCFASSVDGVAVHARWVTSDTKQIPETGQWITVPEREAYVFDSYTVPAWRGKRATRAARAVMDRTLHAEGIRRVWNYVRTDNYASLRALSAFQQRVCTLRYLRLPRGFTFVFGGRLCPLFSGAGTP